MAHGILLFAAHSGPSLGRSILGIALIASGLSAIGGFLTPLAALLIDLCYAGIACAFFPAPSENLYDARLTAIAMIITATAIALLGPGAYSLDGRLFGRREIVIVPSTRPPVT